MKARKLQTESAKRFRQWLKDLQSKGVKTGPEMERFREKAVTQIFKVRNEIKKLEKRKRWLRKMERDAELIAAKGGKRQVTKFSEKEQLELLRRRARLASLLVLEAQSEGLPEKGLQMQRLLTEMDFHKKNAEAYAKQLKAKNQKKGK